MILIPYLTKNFLMKIKFQKIAKEEYDDALNYYNDENKTLGIKFKNEIKQSINNILKFPKETSASRQAKITFPSSCNGPKRKKE